MTALQGISTKLLRPLPRWGNTNRVGWFGVDVGTSAVKMAQIERKGERYRVVTTLVIPAGENGLDEHNLRDGGLVRLLSGQFRKPSRFSVQAAACLLPMSSVEYRCLRLPPAADEELYEMVRQEIEAEDSTESAGKVFDFWTSATEGEDSDGMQEVAIISVNASTATTVANNLAQVGLKCGVMDGLPFALARATTMALPELGETPIAIIDWGNRSTTFTVARRGYPSFTRVLRCHGAGHLVQQLADRLSLGHAECWQLLNIYGVSSSSDAMVTSELKQAIAQTAMPDLQSLAREIQTTLGFLQQQHRELCPQKILLAGGGATIRGVPDVMKKVAGLETELWQLAGASAGGGPPDDPTLALFAPSLALSALGLQE